MSGKSHVIGLDVYLPKSDRDDPWIRWRQPFVDLALPRKESDWLGQVAHERGFVYDRIRQFMTRLALVVVIGVCFVLLPEVAWWAWLLLVPSLVQGLSEIALEKPVRRRLRQKRPSESRRPVARLVNVWWKAYGRRTLNVTGQLGAVAVVANVAAVTFGTWADDATGWLKVAAFAAAVLYANSGCSAPLIEDTVYERGNWGPLLRRIRPFVWPVVCLLAAGFVLLSQVAGRWPSSALPYAYLVCALPYALGLRIREHDRVANAAGRLVRAANARKAEHIGLDLHNMTSLLVKGPIDRIVASDGIDEYDKRTLMAFLDDIEYAHSKSRQAVSLDQEATLLPSVTTVIGRTCNNAGIDPVLDIDLPDPDEEDDSTRAATISQEAYFARQVMKVLTDNALSAYRDRPDIDEPYLKVSAHVQDDHVVVAVTDALDPIPEWKLDRSEGILAQVRPMVIDDRKGELRQIVLETGGKTIEARWPMDFRDVRLMDWDDVE